MAKGLGKRGPKKGHGKGGRPRGGKAPAAVRKYWRDQKRKQARKRSRKK